MALKTEIVVFTQSILFCTQICIKKHSNLTGGINEYGLSDPLLSTVCDSEAFAKCSWRFLVSLQHISTLGKLNVFPHKAMGNT